MASAKKLIEPLSIPGIKQNGLTLPPSSFTSAFNGTSKTSAPPCQSTRGSNSLHRVRQFIDLYSNHPALLAPTLSLQGSLVHISFVYPLGSSHLPSIFSFASSFNENRYSRRYPNQPNDSGFEMVGDNTLGAGPLSARFSPRAHNWTGDISVDASTDWGIGVVVNGKWDAWSLRPGWKSEGRNIGWLEALAVEFLVYILEANDLRDVTISGSLRQPGSHRRL